jgi:type I restriction enzyme S subunit
MSALPRHWKRVTMGSICELVNGRAFKPSDWTTTGLPIVRIQNLNDPDAKFNHYGGVVRSRFLINTGALLFAWSGTPGTSFGAHIWMGGPAILNQHIFNVLFDEHHIDKHFLCLAINQKLGELIDKAHGGVGLRHVTKGKVEETEIDLPPVPEQRRIVAKVNTLLARSKSARMELKRVPTLAERCKHAVLKAAFRGALTADWRIGQPNLQPIAIKTDRSADGRRRRNLDNGSDSFSPPFEIPPRWQWSRVPALGVLDRGRSRHRPRNDPSLYGGPYPFIQTGEVKAAKGRLTSFSKSYSETGLAQSRLWPKGTLCITIAANIAETAILGIDACFPDSVVGFTANEALCNPLFVEFFIRTIRADLAAFAPATAQKNINLETLSAIHVPCPPMKEQTEIVARVEAAFAHIDQVSSEAAHATILLDRLDQMALAKAFRGELVSTDLAEKPGLEVLGRPLEASLQMERPRIPA